MEKKERGRRWRGFLATLGVMVVSYGWAPAAPAQSVEAYEYARTGRPTITLYVWGAVSRPGIWRVEREVDLIEFLTLVNVQSAVGQREDVQEERFLRIYRGSVASTSQGLDVDRNLVFEAELENVLMGTPGIELQDGDVLAVEVETHRRLLTLQNLSSLVGTAASLVLLIFRLSDL